MNKKLLITVIVSAVLISAAAIILVNINSNNKQDMITQKDTAIKIGTAILEEHFPDAFRYPDTVITAEENDGVWRVYNDIQRTGTDKDGNQYVVMGGEIYVELRKSDGKILNIGLND